MKEKVYIGEQVLHPKESFKYFGSTIHKKGGVEEDITNHIKAGC